jgi:enterochelin esterase family protein
MNRLFDEGRHTIAPALRPLVAAGPPTESAIREFFHSKTFPIVEGSQCTFVYQGEADQIFLKHWIFALPTSQPFRRLPGTDLWYLTMELPADSRVEYKLEVVKNGTTELIEDPNNPHRARDPFGANSVVYGTGHMIPDWTRPDPEARSGRLIDFAIMSSALGREQPVTLYLPARFRTTRRYPLLVVHDGGDYLQYSGMKTVLDNLTHRLEIPEMIAAFTYPRERLVEYANHPGHARFLTEELLPKLEANYPLASRPADRCLMGASFGAVASFTTAWRYPAVYGRLLLQSGAFAFTDIGRHGRGPAFDPVVQFMNAYREKPTRVAERVFLSCGIYESLIYENRSLVPILQAAGMEVRYVESRDGHNWENWRDRLREGLSWLFPGPLWMVYE